MGKVWTDRPIQRMEINGLLGCCQALRIKGNVTSIRNIKYCFSLQKMRSFPGAGHICFHFDGCITGGIIKKEKSIGYTVERHIYSRTSCQVESESFS